MSDYRHPDETSGGAFLILLALAAAYIYFVPYQLLGDFKSCDAEKYPYQTFCFKEAS